ncbi:MAG TPA: aldehyde dehydrogenase family protein [Anaerolineales bacterium]|nr:aldehyde dehydrogenase family protein [Anaerolineales bacterium]
MVKQYPFIIAGKQRKSDEIVEVRFPYNNEVVAEVFQASDANLEEAVQSAVKGFEITRKLPSHKRSQILYNLLALMEKRMDDMVSALVMEGGKTQNVAKGEASRAMETVRVAAEEAKRVGGEIVPMDWTEAGEGRLGIVRRFPLGPVLGIAPFNYPLNLSCHKLAPAIAAGNSFILKPASATPLSGLILGELVLEAGFPPEALSVVTCRGSKAEKLVADPRIAYFTFTGSSEVGWHLKSVSGRKRVGLELGGNAAAIVHEDANIPYAVSRIANGGFTNAGQNCISVQRVLIHRPVYNQTLELLLDRISEMKVGDPRDPDVVIGPMIDEWAAKEAFEKVEEAVAQGAQIVLGGKCEGTMFQPTVLVNTSPDMKVNRTELFAPVITVTPYDEFEDAIRLANDTDFGLQSGIFTQNMNRVLHAFEEIEVGGLQVNDVSTFRVDQMPYGGVKGSGIGREGPRYVIEEMTEMKLMVINMPGGIA